MRIYYPKLSRDELLKLLTERTKVLSQKLPLRVVSLFGSYAKSKYTAASDVDLLMVYDGNKRQDDYKVAWETLRIPNLQLHIYTSEEFRTLRASGSQLPREALDRGIVIAEYPQGTS